MKLRDILGTTGLNWTWDSTKSPEENNIAENTTKVLNYLRESPSIQNLIKDQVFLQNFGKLPINVYTSGRKVGSNGGAAVPLDGELIYSKDGNPKEIAVYNGTTSTLSKLAISLLYEAGHLNSVRHLDKPQTYLPTGGVEYLNSLSPEERKAAILTAFENYLNDALKVEASSISLQAAALLALFDENPNDDYIKEQVTSGLHFGQTVRNEGTLYVQVAAGTVVGDYDLVYNPGDTDGLVAWLRNHTGFYNAYRDQFVTTLKERLKLDAGDAIPEAADGKPIKNTNTLGIFQFGAPQEVVRVLGGPGTNLPPAPAELPAQINISGDNSKGTIATASGLRQLFPDPLFPPFFQNDPDATFNSSAINSRSIEELIDKTAVVQLSQEWVGIPGTEQGSTLNIRDLYDSNILVGEIRNSGNGFLEDRLMFVDANNNGVLGDSSQLLNLSNLQNLANANGVIDQSSAGFGSIRLLKPDGTSVSLYDVFVTSIKINADGSFTFNYNDGTSSSGSDYVNLWNQTYRDVASTSIKNASALLDPTTHKDPLLRGLENLAGLDAIASGTSEGVLGGAAAAWYMQEMPEGVIGLPDEGPVNLFAAANYEAS